MGTLSIKFEHDLTFCLNCFHFDEIVLDKKSYANFVWLTVVCSADVFHTLLFAMNKFGSCCCCAHRKRPCFDWWLNNVWFCLPLNGAWKKFLTCLTLILTRDEEVKGSLCPLLGCWNVYLYTELQSTQVLLFNCYRLSLKQFI